MSLKAILGRAYKDIVMHSQSHSGAIGMFHAELQSSPELMEEAKQELARLKNVPDGQCFVSKKHAEFLEAAINAPIPDPSAASQLLATIKPSPQPESREQEDMTSKLKALAGLAKSTVAKVEADAEAAVERLQAAEAKAAAGVGKINTVAGEIETSAESLEDFANQITNGGPPLDK